MKGIDDKLKKLTRRVRLAKAVRGVAIGALFGAAIAVVLAVLDRLGVYYTNWPVIIACCAGGSLLGFVIGFALKVSRLDLADSVDRRLGFKNRLRTALESRGEGEFDQAVLADAEARLEGANGRTAFPLKFSKWHAGAVFGVAIAATLFLLSNSPIFLSDEAKKERAELQKTADQVRRVAKPILDPKNNPGELERELAERLEKLAKDMEKGRMTKKEALIKANELSKTADELAKNRMANAEKMTLDAQTALERMTKEQLEKAGLTEEDLANAKQTKERLTAKENALQSEIDKLKKELEKTGLSGAERNQLESELKQAQKDQLDIKLSKEVLEFLDRLHNMPEFKELMELASKLQQSAGEAKEGKQPTQEEIDEMIKQLEELAEKLKDEESLREFIEQLKKALAECKGGTCSSPALIALLSMLGGNGGRSQDNFYSGTDQVNKNKDEQDIKATTESHAVRGERAEQGEETHIEISGPSSPGERSKTPYTNVLPKYQKSAERAIDRQKIPKSQQKRVREYFESLSGGKGK